MTSFHLYLYGSNQGPIETSFEEAEARLSVLEKLHFEPDGSFVWTRAAGREQIFGMLYDAGGKVRYVELWGQCSRQTWRDLCGAICGGDCGDLQVLLLPERTLQDLQTFEVNILADSDPADV